MGINDYALQTKNESRLAGCVTSTMQIGVTMFDLCPGSNW